ncbi:patatin-like phospholipase family protein [uncultured Croceitalea sp.]|uniref:patatin-like phospholipase family protein n=1 Tax=uncultured Croceitalea sp. TaxID=1798908 RepID=UPI00330681FE
MPDTMLKPFEGIGLCFSGGGYRATFFALGVVSYLNRINFEEAPLLNQVMAISTVSGGTLLGVAYAKAAMAKNFNFDDFYRAFYNQFVPENDKLLERAVALLEKNEVWKNNAYKKRSLINAFALAYAEMDIFKGNFKIFKTAGPSKLKNVCFNATEFSYGLPFRFQNEGVFGNSPLKNKYMEAMEDQIQLSDIVASSSCFPIGFAPLLFPDDYFKNHQAPDYLKLKRHEDFQDGIGILDGGITDNQGVESMLNIGGRKEVKGHFNLIMVNDVASYRMEPWQQDNGKITDKKSLRNTLKGILRWFGVQPLYWILLLAGMLLLALSFFNVFPTVSSAITYTIGGVLVGVGGLLTALGSFLSNIKNNMLTKLNGLIKKNVPEVLMDDVLSFQRLEIGLVKRMLVDRGTSGLKMINEVFLKQIRRLNYRVLYMEPDLENKRITSTVYQLNGEKSPYGNNKFNTEIKPTPSKSLTQTSLVASETPTTLWWDEKDIALNRMDCLIACGQFTSCYNLLDYVLNLKKDGITSPALQKMQTALEKDWVLFNKDPFRWV